MDIRTLLKALLPSFIPLIVFVAAEAVFGETVGLAVGVLTGIGEFLYVLVREKRVDPFILADTLFLGFAGGLSLALRNEIFFKLKPAVIEAIMAAALGLALFLPPDFIRNYMEHQVKGIRLGEDSMPAIRRSLSLMVGILVLHIGLTVAAALFWSTAAWGFVSGGLLYILFGIIVALQFFAARKNAGAKKRVSGSEEILPVIDDEGHIVGNLPVSQCHAPNGSANPKGGGPLHPAVHLHILDGKGGLRLLRRPASAAVEAGKWDSAFSGHVVWGEDLDAALSRGLRKKLGVTVMALESSGGKIEPALRYRLDAGGQSELIHIFVVTYTGDLRPDANEVDNDRIWMIPEIASSIGSGVFTAGFEEDFRRLIESSAKAQA